MCVDTIWQCSITIEKWNIGSLTPWYDYVSDIGVAFKKLETDEIHSIWKGTLLDTPPWHEASAWRTAKRRGAIMFLECDSFVTQQLLDVWHEIHRIHEQVYDKWAACFWIWYLCRLYYLDHPTERIRHSASSVLQQHSHRRSEQQEGS